MSGSAASTGRRTSPPARTTVGLRAAGARSWSAARTPTRRARSLPRSEPILSLGTRRNPQIPLPGLTNSAPTTDSRAVARGFADGARLMKASFGLVRSEPCSLTFIGIFFNVALAGAAARALDGESAGVGDGLSVGWARLSGIAGWAAFSLFVSFVIAFVKSIKGLRWLGAAAQIAWGFATIFVVPLIAFEGLDSGDARRRSFDLARANWQSESGGLGALRAVLLVPGFLFYLDAKLLFEGHVHSPSAKVVLGFVLLCGFAVTVAAGVVRQVFAVELYRACRPNVSLAAA